MKKELIINKSKTMLVILAGGQSRRFGGGYKTLYKFNKISILDRIIQNFKKLKMEIVLNVNSNDCLLYTSPSPRDRQKSRMPSSA